MNHSGKHIIVTGGGSGAGAAIAKAFDGAGAAVTIMGRTRASLQAQGLAFQICDVTDAQSVACAFAAAREKSGPVDIVVANAGAAQSVPFHSMSADQLGQMLAVNLCGVVNAWQAAIDDMLKAGRGRLIAVASTAGLKGYPYVTAYCAAKHAVVGLTRSLACELARTGVTVNALCPGFTRTAMLQRSIDNIARKTGMSEEDAAASLRATNPQGRFIETGEIAGAALWLASDGAKSVNGHALVLSGGEI